MPVMLDEGRDLIFRLWDVHGYLLSCRVSQRGINATGMLENSRLTQKILHFIVIQINSDSEREGKGVFFYDCLSTLVTGHGVKILETKWSLA